MVDHHVPHDGRQLGEFPPHFDTKPSPFFEFFMADMTCSYHEISKNNNCHELSKKITTVNHVMNIYFKRVNGYELMPCRLWTLHSWSARDGLRRGRTREQTQR